MREKKILIMLKLMQIHSMRLFPLFQTSKLICTIYKKEKKEKKREKEKKKKKKLIWHYNKTCGIKLKF